MRRFLLALLLLAGSRFSHASVITFDTVAPNALGFTVEWGQHLQGGYFAESPGGGGVPLVLVAEEPDDQFGPNINRITVNPVGAGFPTAGIVIYFKNAPAVSFADAQIVADFHMEGLPISITPSADGYGARFLYDPPVETPVEVPEGGSALVLLSVGAFACVGLRRLSA